MTVQKLFETDLDLLSESWHASLRSRNLARSTITNYLASVRMLDEFLTAKGMPRSVANIKREHIEMFLADILETRTPSTANSRYVALKQFWMWLLEEGEVAQSPLRNIKQVKVGVPIIPTLSLEEIKTLLNVCKRDKSFLGMRDHALLRLYATTGARRSEIVNLALDQDAYYLRRKQLSQSLNSHAPNVEMPSGYIDFDHKQVVIIANKSNRPRVTNVDPDTMLAIRRYIRARSNHRRFDLPWLWLSNSGRKRYRESGRLTAGGVNQILDRRAEQAGLRHISPHVFRHSWVHHSLAKGLGEGNVAEIAGWSPSSAAAMLARYGAVHRRERALDADREFGIGGDL
ncbi:tyrosine-type recombinase/integrase [SAR202 cluster bacterium JH702]|uniref:Tyrosine-type recombinase/integrase n=1 Tax=Candidatus Lucifugimonas marina TaxID=3038979 RepID=A0ABD4XTW7_9CHLR|nr:tyrosine-type recombinase/integrase [SAR202 cluster bacterium JH702]